MGAIEYFKKLHDWSNRLHKAPTHTKHRRISEYWKVVGESMFSQIEKNLILPSK